MATNSVPATSSQNQGGADIQWVGQYWNGSISAPDTWTWAALLGTGTNPTTSLTLSHATGSPGAATVNIPFPLAVSALAVTSTITNSAGLQAVTSVSQGSCAAGATCTVNITIPVVEPDTAFKAFGCMIINLSAGSPYVSAYGPTSSSTLAVNVVNPTGASATSTYNIQCLVIHN
jgi:hypothetical protein